MNLYTGIIAECLRALVGMAILVRILGYTFQKETKQLFSHKGRLLSFDLFLILTLVIISIYHFNPSFAASSLLAESSSNIRTAMEMQTSGEKLTDQQCAWLDLAKNDVLFAFEEPENAIAGTSQKSSTSDTAKNQIPYLRGDSYDELRAKFQQSASLAEFADRDKALFHDSFSNNNWNEHEFELFSIARGDGASGEIDISVRDPQGQEAFKIDGDRSIELFQTYRRQGLGEVFDTAFFDSCQMPYAIYGVYSTLAFACIFVPLLWVPLSSLRDQWSRIEAALNAITPEPIPGIATTASSEIEPTPESAVQAPARSKLQKSFEESWKECFTFVSRYAELPLLIAAFLGIELAFASATLSNAALKLTLVACLSLIILGVVALAASLIIEQSLNKVKAAIGDDEEIPEWFKARNVQVFLEQVRNESFVGSVFGFAGASLGLGVVIQILQFFQS